MKRYLIISILIIFCAAFFTRCKNQPANNENLPTATTALREIPTDPPTAAPTVTPSPTATPNPTATPTLTPTDTPIPTPEELHEGEVISQLTGLWISEDASKYRPYAVMINNIKAASPQSGLGEADVLYEALVEYGITRFMAIFEAQDTLTESAKRIGSVRSARHYYISFATEYDAIFVHFGRTPYAEDQIAAQKIDDIDGIEGGLGNSAFFRDKSIESPHNVFLKLSTLFNILGQSSMRIEKKSGQKSFFNFYEENTIPENGTPVNKVILKFSSDSKPYFTYDDVSQEYIRYQFGALHIDSNTGEALTFKNILVQFVKEWNIDNNGYQTMKLADANGTGYYITNGTVIPITWSKNESKNERHFYDPNGNELSINAGKTYIAVFPDNNKSGIVFE